MTILTPLNARLEDLERIWLENDPIHLDPSAKESVIKAQSIVRDATESGTAVYGVNTGFGKLASVKIAEEDTASLQRNLVLSHCCGVGIALDIGTTRLMIALKLLSLGRGASGVSWSTIALMEDLLNNGIYPVIPDQGSVGASGDLAPLAHMAATLIGEGEVFLNGKRVSTKEAFLSKGLNPIELGAKEGLALINGTQFSTACALVGLFRAWRNANAAIVTCALSTDAIMGSTQPLEEEIHKLRGHAGQIAVARCQRELMAGSNIRESHRSDDSRVQDPYCIRCQPQVTGAALDLLWFAGKTLEIEANAVTDNPLVLVEKGLSFPVETFMLNQLLLQQILLLLHCQKLEQSRNVEWP